MERVINDTTEYFNPHSHAGSDTYIRIRICLIKISIHTPTQGVTNKLEKLEILGLISIHTPTQGVTLKGNHLQSTMYYFNPHSHAGSDSGTIKFSRTFGNFNPHSHAGSDLDIKWSFNL